MKTSELLAKAAQTARELDHCKKAFRRYMFGKPVACCTEGALRIAGGEYDAGIGVDGGAELARRVLKVALGHGPNEYDVIVAWNDREETTKEDVVALLEKAAEMAAETERVAP